MKQNGIICSFENKNTFLFIFFMCYDNFRERLPQCVDNNGSQRLTDLIFKTSWNRMALYVLFENKNTFLFIYFIFY